LTTFDFVEFCFPNITSCAAVPKTCISNADCAAQELCALTTCAPQNRCVPFLA